MRALVTGGTGYLGRGLCAELLRRGCLVDCLARHDSSLRPEGTTFIHADICDPQSLASISGPYDVVFHLAGLITFDRARLDELMRVNAGGTANMLEASRTWGVPRFVFVSSAITMGVSSSALRPRDESSVADEVSLETNPYLQSKLKAEEFVREAAANGLSAVMVNPTTVYGPGDFTLNSGSLIKTLLRLPAAPCGSGGCNVVDVDDAVAGIIAGWEKGVAGKRYILGGRNISYSELYHAIIKAAGARTLVLPLPGFLRGPAALAAGVLGKIGGGRFLTAQIVNDLFMYKYYSCGLAETDLGWRAATSLESTLNRAMEFYRKEGLL